MIKAILILSAMLSVLASGSMPASADMMNYFMKNEHGRAVVIELFGRETGARWPGDDQVYLLEKDERKSVPITCQAGEQICYGAWVRGNDQHFWGVGPDNDRACDDCCTSCVAKGKPEITLR